MNQEATGQSEGSRAAAHRSRFAVALALLAAAVGLGGCAPWPGTMAATGLEGDARLCFRLLEEVDRRVDEAGVRDGAEHRLPGFPYLRSDRFTASFAGRFGEGAPARGAPPGADGVPIRGDALGLQRNAWIGRMAALDLVARRHETANLPRSSYPVAGYADGDALRARLRDCSAVLVGSHASDPRRARALVKASAVPDDYSALWRAFGLYPVVGIGIAAGVRQWEQQNRAAFGRQRQRPDYERVLYQRYVPQDSPATAGQAIAAAREILGSAQHDALGVPQLAKAATLALARAFAPTFEIATSAEHDRFGPLQWIDLGGLVWPGSDRYWLDVDSSQPVVYHQLAFMRYGEAVLPQLVYSIWFPERPGIDGADWGAGRLDGLIWRVTLDPDGVPLLFDAVHPSGCCHQFFNTSRLMPKAAPASDEVGEWLFMPLGMPIEGWIRGAGEPSLAAMAGGATPSSPGSATGPDAVGQPQSATAGQPQSATAGQPQSATAGQPQSATVGPLALRIATHSHQLIGVGDPRRTWGEPLAPNPAYRLVPADQLRALPLPSSSSRSVFGPDGLVAGSERFDRFALWPSGIDSAGTLRQYGRQPTAFVGRRHFDDADLIEQRFEWRRVAP